MKPGKDHPAWLHKALKDGGKATIDDVPDIAKAAAVGAGLGAAGNALSDRSLARTIGSGIAGSGPTMQEERNRRTWMQRKRGGKVKGKK